MRLVQNNQIFTFDLHFLEFFFSCGLPLHGPGAAGKGVVKQSSTNYAKRADSDWCNRELYRYVDIPHSVCWEETNKS